jgi:signal transduction histidine kinase
MQTTQLRELLAPVVQRFYEKAIEKKVTLDFICPADLPVVESDGEKISWVIQQLLDNGIKFTPQGGRVALSLILQVPFVHVTVTDNGIGIPSERLDEIFEPFYQLDGSSTRRYGGTGLGLALVQKIIEAHGSKIRVTSQVGKGSQFEFNLKIKG